MRYEESILKRYKTNDSCVFEIPLHLIIWGPRSRSFEYDDEENPENLTLLLVRITVIPR